VTLDEEIGTGSYEVRSEGRSQVCRRDGKFPAMTVWWKK